MKIAINSLPRSGTKHLQVNFQSYLIATGKPILCPERRCSLLEPFNFSPSENALQVTMNTISGMSGTEILFDRRYKYPVSLREELTTRFAFFQSTSAGWVFKRTPWYRFDPILYDSATKLDKCIAIIKQDIFKHCVSYALAQQLDVWGLGPKLTKAVEQYTNNKIELDVVAFRKGYNWFKGYHTIKWVKDIQVVKFEEIIKLGDSKEFCDFFEIPYIEFDFQPSLVEYGDNKWNMISNLEELQEIAAQIDKGYQ